MAIPDLISSIQYYIICLHADKQLRKITKESVNIMNTDYTSFVADVLKRLAKLNYIKPGDVPNINLYMDQVTTFMDEHLSDSKRHADDKILTKTMINNYTKNNLLPAPVKKKYSKDHLYLLAYIYYFKSLLSIGDIQKLLNPLTENFFEADSMPDMDIIYKEVYNMCKSQIAGLSKDIMDKAKLSGSAFDHVKDEDERDFLQFFSLVSLLSFDVYMKKNMIENLIDDFDNKHNTSDAGTEKKKSDKKS